MRTVLLALASTAAAALGQTVSVYDYVVVGGGTGGLTVASRLTENPNITVAVLEAGFNAEGLQEVFIPGLIASGQAFKSLDWSYMTVPQTNLNGRTVKMNAGKALGGSTVINSMIFPRAAAQQYDAWGQLNNDSTWTWSALLPFFKRSELFTPPNAFQTSNGVRYLPDVHGDAGRVKVGFPNYFFEQSELWMRAAEGLGFASSPDLANGDPNAIGIPPNSIDSANNTRCSAACAYYTPFAGRTNLVVITNATVSRILWTNSTAGDGQLVANGVEFILTGSNQTQTVSVSKEVIVSAGAVGSPKVLELSGVGNSTILQAAGVTPVLDLPSVGENFVDHVHSWANSFTNISGTKDILGANPAFAAQQLAQWYANRTGMYAAAPRSLGIAAPSNVFTSDQMQTLASQAEANLTLFATEFSNGNPALAQGIAAQHTIALSLFKQNKQLPLELNAEPGYSGPTSASARPQRNYTAINSVLYSPLSRGRTHIISANPLTPPALDPAYWSHPLDVASQVAGIQLARRILAAPPLDSIYTGEFEPGPDRVSDADVEAWLRGVVGSDNHQSSSLAMMPRELGGVVDTKLVVYGTRNVRVVDASIIPFPVSSHLSSTVYMIGERAADIIQGGQA
ncbi:alcohol oxidase [Roridomyces roridus]|uniref:Alcohol oxidase n=1 Tax=Roridomyces roridus TaxID=1738132 RepID=A0AAD7BIN4_9AGAR|nr:alcohol oxidase [Roridomyces roridus]